MQKIRSMKVTLVCSRASSEASIFICSGPILQCLDGRHNKLSTLPPLVSKWVSASGLPLTGTLLPSHLCTISGALSAAVTLS